MKNTLRTLLLSCILPAAGLHAAAVVYEGFNYATGTFTTSAAPTVAATATGLTGNWTWAQNGDTNASTTGIIAQTAFRNMTTDGNALQWHNPTAPGSGAPNNFMYAPLTGAATTALSVADGQSKTLWLSWMLDASAAGTPFVELRNNSAGATGGTVFGVAATITSGLYSTVQSVSIIANNAERAEGSFTFTTNNEYLLVAKLTYSKAGTTTSFDSGSVWVLPNSGTLPANEAALGAATASFTTATTNTANRDPSFLRISNNSSSGQNGYDEIRVGTAFSDVVVVTTTPPPPPPAGALIWDTFPVSFSNFSLQNTITSSGLSWAPDTGANSLSGRINAAAGPLTEPNPTYHTTAVIYLGTGAEMTKNTSDTFTSSVLFLTNEELLPNIAHGTTGFLRSTSSAFNTDAGGCAVWGTVRKTTTSGSSAVLQLYKTGGKISESAAFDLAPSTWYEVVTTMKLASDTQLTELKVAVYSRGADGTAARSLVYSMSATNVTLPNGGFTGNIWTGFGGGNYQNQNFLALDNFAAGKVPQDMVIPALSIQYDAGDLVISCPTQSGFQYQLQSSTNVGGFTNIPGAVLTGNGSVQSFANQPAPAAGAQKFFRVDVTPL